MTLNGCQKPVEGKIEEQSFSVKSADIVDKSRAITAENNNPVQHLNDYKVSKKRGKIGIGGRGFG